MYLHIFSIVDRVNLMSVPDYIHVIAGYQEDIWIQVLEYQVLGVSHKTPGQIDSKIGR